MMKTITDFTQSEIEAGITKARQHLEKEQGHVRILFSPIRITEDNFKDVCGTYARLHPHGYDTVVMVEEHHEVLAKKLPMPAGSTFVTPLGSVTIDDYLRNDFCDEGDDFFIHDEAFGDETTRTHQLMMLQAALENFKALSIKIADENHFIIHELVHVLGEVLASSNVLLVFCCELSKENPDEIDHLKTLAKPDREADLFHYLNSGQSHIKGSAAFVTGAVVAARWGMPLQFLGRESTDGLYAYADRSQVMY